MGHVRNYSLSLREYVNSEDKQIKIARESVKLAVLMLAPFIPHVCEELWRKLEEKRYASTTSWPTVDPEKYDRKILDIIDR